MACPGATTNMREMRAQGAVVSARKVYILAYTINDTALHQIITSTTGTWR